MKPIKKPGAVLIAAILACICAFTGCSGATVLKAGVDLSRIPFSYSDSDGSMTGFAIDLATEVGKRAGLTVEFVSINWDEKGTALQEGKVNSLWGDIPVSGEDQVNLLYTDPYLRDDQILIVSSDSSIKSKGDLAGKSVGAITGSDASASLQADAVAPQLAGGDPIFFDSSSNAFLALISGQIDAVAVDATLGQYYINQNTRAYKVLPGTLSSEEYAVAVRRNDSWLRNRIQSALTAMAEDGTTKGLSEKWFGVDFSVA